MNNHAPKETAALEARGLKVKSKGNSPGKCPKCKTRAIVDYYDDAPNGLKQVYLCDPDFYGCGEKLPLDDKRIANQELLVVWEISHPDDDDVGGYLLVAREVLGALGQLSDEELEAWYFQWDNGVIVDTLEKAELKAPPPPSTVCVHCEKPLSILDEPSDPPLHKKCRKPYAVFGKPQPTTKEQETQIDVDSKSEQSTKSSRNKKAGTGRAAGGGNGSGTKAAGSASKSSATPKPRGSTSVSGKGSARSSKPDPVHGREGKGTRAGQHTKSR